MMPTYCSPLFPPWLARGIIKNLSLCDAMPSAWNDGPLSLLYLLFQWRQKLIPNATIWRQHGCFFSDQLRETLSWKSPSNTRRQINYTWGLRFLRAAKRDCVIRWSGPFYKGSSSGNTAVGFFNHSDAPPVFERCLNISWGHMWTPWGLIALSAGIG
jgi:hypothetical protein